MKAEHLAHQANRTAKRVATNEASRVNKSDIATMRPIYIQGAMIATQCGFPAEYKIAGRASSSGAKGSKAQRRDNNAEIITSVVQAAEAMYAVILEHNLLSKVRAKAAPIEVALTSNTAKKKASDLMEDVDNDNFDDV